jgi:hypothetical protein
VAGLSRAAGKRGRETCCSPPTRPGVVRTSNALALVRTLGLWEGRTVYAILMAAAFSRPSSVTLSSRITNFWTLPVTVMGKASTKWT